MSFGRSSCCWGRRGSVLTQDHALQLDALLTAGCDKVFVETGSGTRTDRPELARVLEQVRQDDVLVVWRLDRLARSLRHLIDIADDLSRRGVALKSITESIDTTTPSGRFMFNILGALSSMEREIIVERTRAGLVAAAARGRRGGRPAALDESKIRAAKAMLASGSMSAIEVAQQLGCAPSTLYRHLPGGRTAVAESAMSAAT
jgi:DNA invertase Pin-like site-specific DNA recombinase